MSGLTPDTNPEDPTRLAIFQKIDALVSQILAIKQKHDENSSVTQDLVALDRISKPLMQQIAQIKKTATK